MSPPDYCMFTPCDESKCGCKEWRAQRAAEALDEPATGRVDCLPIPTDRNQGWPDIFAVLYTDSINGEQTCRDDLWIATTGAIKAAIEQAQHHAYAEGRKDEREVWEPLARKAYEALESCDGDKDGYKGPVQWYRDDLVEAAYSSLAAALGEKP